MIVVILETQVIESGAPILCLEEEGRHIETHGASSDSFTLKYFGVCGQGPGPSLDPDMPHTVKQTIPLDSVRNPGQPQTDPEGSSSCRCLFPWLL